MNLELGDTSLIIAECRKEGLLRNQTAYVLATAYHESGHTMKPISEYGGLKYLKSKKYYPFFGRGYVQLTWESNYKKQGLKYNVDFVKNPDLLLTPKYAVPILVSGMKHGEFTGKKLSDYITLEKSDFRGARKIINGTDKSSLIAELASKYDDLLKPIWELDEKPTEKPVEEVHEVSSTTLVPTPEKRSVWARLASWLVDLIVEVVTNRRN